LNVLTPLMYSMGWASMCGSGEMENCFYKYISARATITHRVANKRYGLVGTPAAALAFGAHGFFETRPAPALS
jgi:hypothetical protein